jgi:hypothetical protein
MPRAGFEPETQANKRPQTYALDRAVTGIGNAYINIILVRILCVNENSIKILRQRTILN